MIAQPTGINMLAGIKYNIDLVVQTARLGDQNPRATHLTFTMCPGTDMFMPPEAV